MTPRRLHRLYVQRALPQAYLVRRFVASTVPERTIGTCAEIGAGHAPFEGCIRTYWAPRHYLRTDLVGGKDTQIVADGAQLPFAAGSIDLVAAFQVLPFVEAPDLVLKEAARVLVPGGFLLLSYPFLYGECDMRDYRRWTMEGIEHDTARAGFTVVQHRRIGGPFFMSAALTTSIISALIPGRRMSWKVSSSRAGIARILAVTLLTAPFQLFGWIGLVLDRLWPNPSVYMGGIILLRKPGR